MSRRALLACAVSAALAGTGCDLVFTLDGPEARRPNVHFTGCFSGPVSSPGTGTLTIVFEASAVATHNLEGCMRLTSPEFDSAFSGFVDDENEARAPLAVLAPGFPAMVMVAQKTPPDRDVNAETVSVRNETGNQPFLLAPSLSRCTTTCADLGIAQQFAPGGGP